jgi:hypothetical protein
MLECGQVKVVEAVVIRYCMNNEFYKNAEFLAYRRDLKILFSDDRERHSQLWSSVQILPFFCAFPCIISRLRT